ncbi:zinc ribbon domain-containing protein [Oceanibacterium hippocampi]|uniref:Recombinase zinc beta ribbon domain-containing protein n=1 Tax=Oceanibacterium hippocampi TaxID=745714 RepID=A0A1Y5TM35_9PROT|nr:zinc ribbon domain-containing protein [Oceanibacterium hippocampi]SLN67182.1 hypothetical protein OCH7691_03121 [Oceanibacterium hippocampi]
MIPAGSRQNQRATARSICQHRPRHLLSGLLQCGACGATYTIVGKARYGCAGHRNRGTCDNDRTIARQALEARVLEGLKSALFTPDLVRTFVAEFQSEWNRLQAEADADWTASGRTLEQTKAKIDAVMSVTCSPESPRL